MWWDKPGTKPKPEGKPFPFMKIRWIGFVVTSLIFLVTTVSLATQGLNMGLDFTGGVQIEATRDTPFDVAIQAITAFPMKAGNTRAARRTCGQTPATIRS